MISSTEAAKPAETDFPDAELLRVAEQFIAACRAIDAIYEAELMPSAHEIARLPLDNLRHDLMDRLCGLPATTLAAHAARARAYAAWFCDPIELEDDPNDIAEVRLRAALLRDLVGDRSPAGGDARLLRLCADLVAADAEHDRADADPLYAQAHLDQAIDDWHRLVDEITELPATTAGGAQAKARAALLAVRRGIERADSPGGPDGYELLALSLARDVAGGVVAL